MTRPEGPGGEPADGAPRNYPDSPVRVFLRPVGTPLPLGFLALAIGSFVVSGHELHWVPAAGKGTVALVLVALVAPLQAVTCVFGFLSRDAIAGTGMGVLAGTWLALGLGFRFSPAAHDPTLGLLLFASAAALWAPIIGSRTKKLVASAVMTTTSLRYLLTAAYQFSGARAWETAGGIAGLVLAVVALYAALALELESGTHRTVLPTGRRGRWTRLLEADFSDQVEQVHHEAGVRRSL